MNIGDFKKLKSNNRIMDELVKQQEQSINDKIIGHLLSSLKDIVILKAWTEKHCSSYKLIKPYRVSGQIIVNQLRNFGYDAVKLSDLIRWLEENCDTLMHKEIVKANGEVHYVFYTFNDWVRSASEVYPEDKIKNPTFTLDKDGNVCVTGEDFMNARDTDRFPVTIYRITRSKEVL